MRQTAAIMRVHLGSDHAGFELKGALIARLGELGHQAVDHGPASYDSEDDYPPYVMAAAAATAAEPDSLGIVIGGSGNGEAIAANKVPGRALRAGLDATRRRSSGRLHNNANVVSLGAREYPLEDAIRFAEVFSATAFCDEPRHERRLAMLTDYERSGSLPSLPPVADRSPVALRADAGSGECGSLRLRAVLGCRDQRAAVPARCRGGSGRFSMRAAAWRITRSRSAVGQVLGARAGDVAGTHGAVDSDLGRARPDQSAEAVLAVTCVMLVAIASGRLGTLAIMPEGHTIHRLARDTPRLFGGAAVQAQQPAGPLQRRRGADQRTGAAQGRAVRQAPALPVRGTPRTAARAPWACTASSSGGRLPAPEPRGALRLRLIATARATPICAGRPPASCCCPAR